MVLKGLKRGSLLEISDMSGKCFPEAKLGFDGRDESHIAHDTPW
jgi:hypothetical protein